MRNRADVSIIIPVINKWELTSACLESLATHTPDSVEVIVVDNGSSDETREACSPHCERLFGERFQVLRQERNLNFAPACNIGARSARGEHLLFLNNDTLVTPGWLPPLLDRLKSSAQLGAVGPLLLYPAVGPLRDRVQHLGVCFEPQFYLQHLYEYFPADHPAVRRPRVFQALTAAALLIPTSLFLNLGLFDEAFINGGEDVELGLRIRQGGYSLTCETSSRVYHLTSQTPGRHDNEQHNARILKERALQRIYPDVHLHAVQDGYVPALTPWLQFHLDLPDRRKDIYARQAKTCDGPDKLSTLLDREPLWVEGYGLVAAYEESMGNLDKALAYRFIAAKLMHHPETLIPLHRLAARVEDRGKLAYTTSALRWFSVHNDPECFREVADSMYCLLGRAGPHPLASIYKRWLDEQPRIRGILRQWSLACESALSGKHF